MLGLEVYSYTGAIRDGLYGVLTKAKWARLEPLIEAVRPHGKTEPRALRRTVEAIIWRHDKGAKWRAIPAELRPWWMAAQCWNRWFPWVFGSACWHWRRSAAAVQSWVWRS